MFISQALAADAPVEAVTEAVGDAAQQVGDAASHEAFYQDPTFFVALAFITFFVVLGKKIFGVLNAMLDGRAQKISDEIEQATRLREEAQEMLASYEKKQHEALKEAESIVNAAKDEAKRLASEAAEQLELSLKRAEQLAKDRIAQAETQAIAQVKAQAVNLAMDAAQRILESETAGKKADALIDDAIKALDGKLH